MEATANTAAGKSPDLHHEGHGLQVVNMSCLVCGEELTCKEHKFVEYRPGRFRRICMHHQMMEICDPDEQD